MTQKPRPPILIAGGGIGGLSAAIALSRRGFDARILEREAKISEAGAGIQLGPNATRILRDWGLRQVLEESAFQPQSIDIFDALTGAKLNAAPLGAAIAERHGAPYLTLLRADLQRILLDAAHTCGVNVTLNFSTHGVSQTREGVVATSVSGVEAIGSALIGADGVRSAVRRCSFPAVALREDGRIAWRASLPRGRNDSDNVSLWLDGAFHLVRYPVNRGETENLVAVTAGRDANTPNFDGWPPTLHDAMPPTDLWRPWPLYELGPLDVWSHGLVTLLGDAAHPITPFLASGAVMAIEDAAVLADEAARTPDDLAVAFQRYERKRQPRVADVTRRSRRMGEIYHMRGGMRLARNAVIAATPSRLLLSRNDWLYGFRVSEG